VKQAHAKKLTQQRAPNRVLKFNISAPSTASVKLDGDPTLNLSRGRIKQKRKRILRNL
jgi:hypothetical protein